MTSQNGDRVLFESLKLQGRSSIPLQTYRASGNKKQTGKTTAAQDVADHSTEADLAHKKLEHTASNTAVDTHLGDKEVSTNAFLKNEAVNEEITETNIKAIERIKSGSNKICIREDLAKEIQPHYFRDLNRGAH